MKEGHFKFNEKNPTGFSETINTKDDAFNAIQAIVEQGEGSSSSLSIPKADQPTTDTGSFFDPSSSHYEKFLKVKQELPDVYSGDGSAPTEQAALDTQWANFLDSLQSWFNSGGAPSDDFYPQMYGSESVLGVGPAIQAVWKAGAIPAFNPPTPSS
ncbi:ferritin-like domain-containing protein [Candidatus Entotheonella palauensis]|uniref:ferritin-like domain-containing protein n=1 Tax=Candidatus Entotheonella palauensis TaxID=93172 RepID=UPI000B7CF0EE|nr:ferritin-like domain-containing protein [Candidatus Entotheonella palauensis]